MTDPAGVLASNTALGDRRFEMVLRNRVVFGVGSSETVPEFLVLSKPSRVFIVTDPGRGYRFVASVAQRQPMDGYEPTVTKPAHREAANALATVIAEAKPPPPPTVTMVSAARNADLITDISPAT